MLFLKYLESSFNTLSLKVKIELFLFPLILVFVYIYIFVFKQESKKEVIIVTNSNYIDKYETQKMNKKVVNVLKDIEIFAKNKNTILTTVSSDNKTIDLGIKSNILKQIEFIKYLEDYNNFSKIDSLALNKNEMNIKISFNKFFIKRKVDIKNRLENLININSIKLKLKAIISQKVLINSKWLKINEMINSYKIIKIDKNSVYLNDSFKTIKIKLHEDDF